METRTDKPEVDCRQQALTLKFRVLSIQFTLVRSDDECYREDVAREPADAPLGSASIRYRMERVCIWLWRYRVGHLKDVSDSRDCGAQSTIMLTAILSEYKLRIISTNTSPDRHSLFLLSD